MISPAFWMNTASPMRTSSWAMTSALCSDARDTVVFASSTGSRTATGVERARAADLNDDAGVADDRPRALGGDPVGEAHLGNLEVKPRMSWSRYRSTFTTAPSVLVRVLGARASIAPMRVTSSSSEAACVSLRCVGCRLCSASQRSDSGVALVRQVALDELVEERAQRPLADLAGRPSCGPAPAAALRGFANGSRPSAARSSFRRSWLRRKMSTSPRRCHAASAVCDGQGHAADACGRSR